MFKRLFQSLPQRDFVLLAARTPDRGDSAAAAGSSVDKEWVTEHARQVDVSFLMHTLWLSPPPPNAEGPSLQSALRAGALQGLGLGWRSKTIYCDPGELALRPYLT